MITLGNKVSWHFKTTLQQIKNQQKSNTDNYLHSRQSKITT